jgi:biotin transport system substrate-specific component
MTAAASRKRASDKAYAPPVQAAIVVAGVVALWGASFVSIPIGPVPITLQTFAVFALAGVFGGRLGLAIVLAWLAIAAMGAPVLANGAGGWRAVTGATAGFLVGMAAAAWICGEGARRTSGWLPLTFLFLGGHVIVLAVGWAGLASFMSPGPALESGILPLLPGAALKSLAAALTVRLVSR